MTTSWSAILLAEADGFHKMRDLMDRLKLPYSMPAVSDGPIVIDLTRLADLTEAPHG